MSVTKKKEPITAFLIVHAPEKVDGKRVQKVDIVFNFVGEINFLSASQPKRQGA